MSQFQDRRCAACDHPDIHHGRHFGCGDCPVERRCMSFVERDQVLSVKVEVLSTTPHALPEPTPQMGIVLAQPTSVPRRRGFWERLFGSVSGTGYDHDPDGHP